MKKAGIKVVESPAEIGNTMLKAVTNLKSQKSKVKSVSSKKKNKDKSKKRTVKKVKKK